MSRNASCRLVDPAPGAITELGRLFERYRLHYGQAPAPAATTVWIDEMVTSRELMFYSASEGGRMVGFAAVHQIPASLRLSRFWLLRDLFVDPDNRRHGIGRRLVDTVRQDALDAGALRLSLQTENSNAAALGLYRGCGFTTHSDLTTLSFNLAG